MSVCQVPLHARFVWPPSLLQPQEALVVPPVGGGANRSLALCKERLYMGVSSNGGATQTPQNDHF